MLRFFQSKRPSVWTRVDTSEKIATSTSTSERLADDAEREGEQVKKVEFMLDKLGEEYDGVITGVTQFGLFVALANRFVEGLVHLRGLPDYFERSV